MMNKVMITTIAALGFSFCLSAYAEDNCKIQIAVSAPPVEAEQSVAFNITNENGTSNAVIINAGDAPQTIDNLACSDSAYTISATPFSTPNKPMFMKQNQAPIIGECTLKAGQISLNGSGNNVAVVYPNDFVCNTND